MEQDEAAAWTVAKRIKAVLDRARLRRPLLLHGRDATVWSLVERAAEQRLSTRVRLEDGGLLPDGTTAPANAVLVAAAVALVESVADEAR